MTPAYEAKMTEVRQSLRVLLVDDQPDNLISLEAALAPLGYTLVTADSGTRALKTLLEQDIALIIMDIAMPDMDGFETVRLIRECKRYQTTPIIFLTAIHCDESAQAKGYSVGGSDYLMKPIDLNILRSKVRTFAELIAESHSTQAQLMQVRDHFITVAAHELKTPLTALLGYGQLLQRRARSGGEFSQRDRALLNTMVEQVERLNRLANLLLDTAHMRDLRLEKEPVDLCALVQRTFQLVEGMTSDAYTFECKTPGEPIMIQGDELRLEQVFYNLIQNAVKYSLEGGLVRIWVEQRDRQACVGIMDQGIGIPLEAQEAIFGQFYRATNAIAENITGLGLGLAIVKELIALHGGTIELESREGEGSTFTVCLPQEPGAGSG